MTIQKQILKYQLKLFEQYNMQSELKENVNYPDDIHYDYMLVVYSNIQDENKEMKINSIIFDTFMDFCDNHKINGQLMFRTYANVKKFYNERMNKEEK